MLSLRVSSLFLRFHVPSLFAPTTPDNEGVFVLVCTDLFVFLILSLYNSGNSGHNLQLRSRRRAHVL